MSKPILVLDFDGVIHSYTSPWQGPTVISDPPVPGALGFIHAALESFRVAIYSSRSGQPGGIDAMRAYIEHHVQELFGLGQLTRVPWLDNIEYPTEKPAAFLSIDDRALTFEGVWPDIEKLKAFKPWNKRG